MSETKKHEKMTDQTRLLAVVVEVLGGWCGFLGLGYLLTGVIEGRDDKVTTGFILLPSWWAALLILGVLLAASGGCAAICVVPVWMAVPLITGNSLRLLNKDNN